MRKPTKKYPLKKLYDYHEIIEYIEGKYSIKTRGYANSYLQFDEYKEDIEKGLIKERPYLDFWHWVLDQDDSISNGSKGVLWAVDEYICDKTNTPKFVREILSIIKDEGFINEENEFEFWVEW